MIDFIRSNSIYLAVIIGIIIGIPAMRVYEKKESKDSLVKDILLAVIFSAVSVFSVLLFASIEGVLCGNGFHVEALSTYGLYLIAPLLILPFRKSRRVVFDKFAIYILPSMFLQRIRCFITNCCYGKLIGKTSLRWPTREAELVFYVVMLVLFLMKVKNTEFKQGSLFPVLMICYGTFRFVVEFARENGSGLFHLAHLWSLLTLIIGISIYIEVVRPNKSHKNNNRGKND